MRPGEYVAGSTQTNDLEEIDQALKEEGILLGDLLAGTIHSVKLDVLFGKTNCTACHRRQQILNEWHRQGKAFIKWLKS